MNRARDTSDVAIFGKVTLVQEITSDVQAGFLIYLPFFGEGCNPQQHFRPLGVNKRLRLQPITHRQSYEWRLG